MKNFVQYAPTEIVFGKDAEKEAGRLAKKWGGDKVLIVYGGGSVVRSGLLDKVKGELTAEGVAYEELGGVRPNPRLGLVREGVKKAADFGADLILALGGGSVIDTAKAVAIGAADTSVDVWSYWAGERQVQAALPVGVVLTISAAGSETSDSAVITNEETGKKAGINTDFNRPKFAIMNPELTYTLPKYQLTCGIVDIMMHTLERYLTPKGGETDITDRLAEGLLIATRDAGRRALANPNDYEARATLMWAGSISHNDYTGCGRARLFPVHKLEHELSAFRDEIAHGAGLSVLFPAWALYEMERDIPRFAQLANRVLGVEMDFANPARTAREGILTLKRFFEEINMPVHMAQLGIKPESYEKLAENTMRTVGGPVKSYSPLDKEAIMAIYRLAE